MTSRLESGITVTPAEIMVAAAARLIKNGDICFVGTGLPMIAAYFAQRTHAPDAVLIFESGIIDARPKHLAPGVGDFSLMHGASKAAGLYYALSLLQSGRVDLGFLGAAEIDRHGNINTTAIGPLERPTVRLPGSGGANDIASLARQVVVIVPHEPRKLVERVGYITTPGFLSGPGAREAAGLKGQGPKAVITNLAVFEFDPVDKQMVIKSIHPGVNPDVVRDRTGFALDIPEGTPRTPLPTEEEVKLIRSIDPDGLYLDKART